MSDFDQFAKLRFQHFHNPDYAGRDREHVIKLEYWRLPGGGVHPDFARFACAVPPVRLIEILEQQREKMPLAEFGRLRKRIAELAVYAGMRLGCVVEKSRGTTYDWSTIAAFAPDNDGYAGIVWLGDDPRWITLIDRRLGKPGRKQTACAWQGDWKNPALMPDLARDAV